LKENNLLESTLILYTSDNGFSFGEHGLIDKRHMYEESMRIPLLAHCPELIKPNTKVSEFIQNLDFAPTILEAAGYQAPQDMEGKSFLSLLKGEKTPQRFRCGAAACGRPQSGTCILIINLQTEIYACTANIFKPRIDANER
jgi:arylsulfatase A-like enzyme